MPLNTQKHLIIVTGLSGSGHSSALKCLEDLGYNAIDNLPPALLTSLLETVSQQSLAIGIDTRSRDFNPSEVIDLLMRVKKDAAYRVHLLFLDADNNVLINRFKFNRRRHPFERGKSIEETINDERAFLEGLKERSDFIIDTSTFTLAELKQSIVGYCSLENENRLSVNVMSFSYKHGIPREADLVFDVRFLKNPYYDEVLRTKTGLDDDVAKYVKSDVIYDTFMKSLKDFLVLLLPRYQQEGKIYLTLAIGCTGGQHRSVCIAPELAAFLKDEGYKTSVKHRELEGVFGHGSL